jgi:glycosyltransferase involved in cell wall biosynthesis
MNGRLRFLHIFPNFGPGGMELRVTRIINGMGPDISHTILALLGNYDARAFIDPGVRVECLASRPGTGLIRSVWALRALLQEVKHDLLLTYNWGSMDAVLSTWTTGFRPMVHHECGFGPEESVGLKRRRIWARRILLRRVLGVAVTSRTLREITIQQYGVPPGKVRWIRTGIDVERFRPGLTREWRRQAGVGDDELLFGFVGVLRTEKNLPFLLRAFAKAGISNARLVLVGDGAERLALEQTAREEGIAGRVLFTGRVPEPAVYLAALDVFLLCSTTEQTSNALLEAMSCGLPAVSTDVGDSREMLGNTGSPAIVPPGDLEGYAAALRTLAGSAECRERLGTANRKRCLEQYRVERMVREYEALYRAAYSGATRVGASASA